MISHLHVINIANGGYGVAKDNGKTVFIDYALPGDVLNTKIYKDHKNYSFAEIVDIIKPSENRINPACPNFTLCGGCSYLNVPYNVELGYKHQIVKDLLQRMAGIDENSIPEIDVISGERFGYRSHATIKADGARKGFFMKESSELVEFPGEGCLLIDMDMNEYIKNIEGEIIDRELRLSRDFEGNVLSGLGDMHCSITESVGDIKYRHDLSGFFQSNFYLRESMIGKVIEYASPCKSEKFVDICCGCGFFTLPLARLTAEGFGFDSDRNGIENARYNCEINGIENAIFSVNDEAAIHPYRYSPDFVIIDPPRSGISKKGRRTINTMNPSRIIYVSCNPATFARDIVDFIKNGYALNRLTLIDMFPCTKHIEVISQLTAIHR